jgi:hypothetical protein
LGPSGGAPSSLRARRAGLLMRAARSGTDDLTVLEDSGDCVLDLLLDTLSSLGGSETGVGAVGLSGKEVNAKGALIADITPPKAE